MYYMEKTNGPTECVIEGLTAVWERIKNAPGDYRRVFLGGGANPPCLGVKNGPGEIRLAIDAIDQPIWKELVEREHMIEAIAQQQLDENGEGLFPEEVDARWSLASKELKSIKELQAAVMAACNR